MTTPNQVEKAAMFARLHDSGCFILPNAWDMPSAALIVEAGFPAMATTSSGVAFTQGMPDGEHIGRDRMLAITTEIAARVPVPVSADLEAGYGPGPEDVADTVRLAIAGGLVGCNIEDTDPATHRLFEFDHAVARIRAGAEAAHAAGLQNFVLNARTDPYLRRLGTAEQCFEEAVRRANAFLDAGARCVFVPGTVDLDIITRLAKAISGPLNVLGQPGGVVPPLAALQRAGIRRLTIGGGLMLASYGFALRSLKDVAASGVLGYPAGPSHVEMNELMQKYRDGV